MSALETQRAIALDWLEGSVETSATVMATVLECDRARARYVMRSLERDGLVAHSTRRINAPECRISVWSLRRAA